MTFHLSDEFIAQYEGVKPPFGFTDAAGTSLGEITFIRTYARLKDDGTKETWVDVCRRVIEGMYGIQKQYVRKNNLPWSNAKAQRSAKDAFDRMFHMKWLPPGRGLWSMGTKMVMEGNSAPLQNCGFVSTAAMTKDNPGYVFGWIMEASMLGIGVGFDGKGAGKFEVVAPDGTKPHRISDDREGWALSLQTLINSYLVPGSPEAVFDYSEIRPAGAPIKTFGGSASGPAPLKELHEAVRKILNARVGEKLTLTDIADIGNLIGVCVVAGNVRRSAELFMGPATPEFLGLKDYTQASGQLRAAWSWMSNNSVETTVTEDLDVIVPGIIANGEPGVIWMDTTRAYGRLVDPPNYKDRRAAGYNPCFHPDTMIETVDGPKRIADITEPTKVYTRGHDGKLTIRDASASWVSKRNAQTITIGLSNGDELTVTPDHKLMLAGGEWVEAGTLKVNDSLERLCRTRRGWRYSGVHLSSQPPSEQVMEHRMVWEGVNGTIPAGYDIDHINRDHHDNRLDNLRMLNHAEHAKLSRSQVPNDHQVSGYYPDGTYGFISGPDSKGGRKDLVGKIDPPRTTRWVNQHTVKYIKAGPVTDVYDLTVDDTHNMIANGVVAHNCAEQSLESFECCTLVEAFPSNHETLEDYLKTLKYAYLYAKTVTLMTTPWPETNAIMLRNRRIGAGMSGIADFYDARGEAELVRWQDSGYERVGELDVSYSEWLGIRESIKSTTVKPSGTVSLLAGVSPGVHWQPGSKHYFRTMRVGKNDPLVVAAERAGYRIEDSVSDPDHTKVIYFPMVRTSERGEHDVSLLEKLNLAITSQKWWSDNSVSVTLSYHESEASQIGSVLKLARGNLKTVSFLPLAVGTYEQMPYTQADASEIEDATMTHLPIDTDYLYSNGVDAIGEKFCTTDTCTI